MCDETVIFGNIAPYQAPSAFEGGWGAREVVCFQEYLSWAFNSEKYSTFLGYRWYSKNVNYIVEYLKDLTGYSVPFKIISEGENLLSVAFFPRIPSEAKIPRKKRPYFYYLLNAFLRSFSSNNLLSPSMPECEGDIFEIIKYHRTCEKNFSQDADDPIIIEELIKAIFNWGNYKYIPSGIRWQTEILRVLRDPQKSVKYVKYRGKYVNDVYNFAWAVNNKYWNYVHSYVGSGKIPVFVDFPEFWEAYARVEMELEDLW